MMHGCWLALSNCKIFDRVTLGGLSGAIGSPAHGPITHPMSKLLRTAADLRRASLIAIGISAASSSAAISQTSTGRVLVRVTADSLPIPGATVASGTANGATDRLGVATFTLPT